MTTTHHYRHIIDIHTRAFVVTVASFLALSLSASVRADGPYQATGLKVGEVTDTEAIVWVRLTARPAPNSADAPMVQIEYHESQSGQRVRNRKRRVLGVAYPDGLTVADIRHAAPGAAGEVKLTYRPKGASIWLETAWQAVDANRDFTHQFLLTKLVPKTTYELQVHARAKSTSDPGPTLTGRFRTAAASETASRVVFTVSTGQAFKDQDRSDGYNIYPRMAELDPDFFVHTGDIIYYDDLAKTAALARYHWQRTYSRPTNVEFHRHVASYFIKDDHDTWQNDCWPTMQRDNMYQFTFEQGLGIFREQVPMRDSTYRTYRWGKDLQVWQVEGRDFRSPNDQPDGPDKTIWGAEQKAWFKRTVEASDATFRVLISPTPLVGPDRTNKADNHANRAFATEGKELREFLSRQQNMFVVCGDRHWQYFSVHPETQVHEYSCGPASDAHAGGWKQSDWVDAYHRYLNVIGGFLSVTVDRPQGSPTISFRFHDSDGAVKFEDRHDAASGRGRANP